MIAENSQEGDMEFSEVKEFANKLQTNIELVVLGKSESVKMVIAALFAGGHVLLEDVPGSGKTLLAKTLAASIDGSFSRIQMTPDLLPADITGINYYNRKHSEFEFRPGPVFANILIADEINRATPKTQAGLLEGMEEHQVTVDGQTYPLPEPFMVIATQNPIDNQGVFPLPEAQIDRFFCRITMEYPTKADTVSILRLHGAVRDSVQLKPVMTVEEAEAVKILADTVAVQDDLYDYIAAIMEMTRKHAGVLLGLSARGGIALVRAAKVWAAMEGRRYVLPDDIKRMAVPVCAHRLVLKNNLRLKQNAAEEIIKEILKTVPVPTEELG